MFLCGRVSASRRLIPDACAEGEAAAVRGGWNPRFDRIPPIGTSGNKSLFASPVGSPIAAPFDPRKPLDLA
jgi:hypothetical protein